MSFRRYAPVKGPGTQGLGVHLGIRKQGNKGMTFVISLRSDVVERMGLEPGVSTMEVSIGRFADSGLLMVTPGTETALRLNRPSRGASYGEIGMAAREVTSAPVPHALERLPDAAVRFDEEGRLLIRRPAWLPPLAIDVHPSDRKGG